MDVARLLESCGVRALTVHARTRNDGYKGGADWSYFPAIKSAVRIPIIGNGDIDTPVRAELALVESGVDALMIGRGAIADPWIFERIKYYLRTGLDMPERSLLDRVSLLLENLRMSIEHKGDERRAVIEMRKLYSGYLRGFPGVANLRTDLMSMLRYDDISARLNDFVCASEPSLAGAA